MSGRLHEPLTRYVKLWVAHAPGMPGTFSLPPRVNNPDMHHGTCVAHGIVNSGLLTSGFLWSRLAGKTFPAFPAHVQPAIFLSDKRPIDWLVWPADWFINWGTHNQMTEGQNTQYRRLESPTTRLFQYLVQITYKNFKVPLYWSFLSGIVPTCRDVIIVFMLCHHHYLHQLKI